MDCSNTRSSSWNELEGKWKQMKGTVREKFGKLTDDDLQVIGGKKDQFLGKLQERYGISREQAQKDLDNWLQGQHQMEPRTHATGRSPEKETLRTRTSGGSSSGG
jgi:uncharacterized protein YjbJ (UPF0337 family)